MDIFFGVLVLSLLLLVLNKGSRRCPPGGSEGDPDRDPTMGGAPMRPEFDDSTCSSSGDSGSGGDGD